MADLVNKLRQGVEVELRSVSALPSGGEYVFDLEDSSSQSSLPIQKTTRRTVMSLNYLEFQAKEVHREERKQGAVSAQRSPELMSIAPGGNKYAYDLIAYVGTKTHLEGWRLSDIQKELASNKQCPNVPLSSLYDIQHKFLFYFGELHKQAAPRIKGYFHGRGDVTWAIDGTLEFGSPVFFGVKETKEGIFLGSWKIPTENFADISSCLSETITQYGRPGRVLHDLSEIMIKACKTSLPNTPNSVCQQHLLSDIGEDIYKSPQDSLYKRLKAMKLQLRLREQRKGQTDWLRRNTGEGKISLILNDLLNGKGLNIEWNESLGREVLLSLHDWMLDYAKDGGRQGFPFDPHLLYLHRRIVKTYDASKRLLSIEAVKRKAPIVIYNFLNQLEKYQADPDIIEAASLYEKARNIFERARTALRFQAKGQAPMREAYELNSGEREEVKKSLNELLTDFEEEKRCCTDPKEKKCYATVLTHLEKYSPYLFQSNIFDTDKEDIVETTTNEIERHWNERKRIRRRTHGRGKLTRDFQALPAEFMLVPNLENQRYVELVLGSLEKLPEKLAEAGKKAGPFGLWQKKRKPVNIGRLPARMLKQENFIEQLINVYDGHCGLEGKK